MSGWGMSANKARAAGALMPRLAQERVHRRTGPARVIALDELWT